MAPTRLNPATLNQLYLRSEGVSLLLDIADGELPAVIHWGADLGDISAEEATTLALGNVQHISINDQEKPTRMNLLATHEAGWHGRPAIDGARANGAGWTTKLKVTALTSEVTGGVQSGTFFTGGAGTLTFTTEDDDAQVKVTIIIELLPSGLVRSRAALTNTGADTYEVRELGIVFPVPSNARELFDLAGHWGKERVPQRRPFTVGIHLRESRKGRTGADAPTLLTAGVPGFGFETGDVWGVHTAFSGNHRSWAERAYTGVAVIGGSEVLLPGEALLEPGQTYTGAWVYAAYGNGQDQQATRIHRWLRSRENHPQRPRPVTLNVWEAVYFDHNLERLKDLADKAAELGIERYVLDDGWFGSRRDDTSGLGDWVVSSEMWPNGLTPLIEHVEALGMEFGLWFEPEMVNPDSDVAREHPEWMMAPAGRLPVTIRNQQVMNLTIPEAYTHVRDQMFTVLTENPGIKYIKWDHNRHLVEAGNPATGAPGVHAQTLAAYRLMEEIKENFPGIEIESCSSGGARVDLEVLQRTDRVWTSDCIDPLERQQMHRFTHQLIVPELMGSHIASGSSHTTGRTHTLHFRAATAFWGHLGVEWDLTEASAEEFAELAEWITFHKKHRPLLHSGDVVRLDLFDRAVGVHGVVSTDKKEALFGINQLDFADTNPIGKFRLAGLDPEATYEILDVTPGHADAHTGFRPSPVWPVNKPIRVSGRALTTAGLFLPGLWPESSRILHLTAI
ncbi:MAG: alpha-galactosidase [Rothia sp. (in: high G+C Gram-positive bacteria)]|nr:alpha-galactosidase [Rothia sp. (in: high G+C Gram-positive bacteria)]